MSAQVAMTRTVPSRFAITVFFDQTPVDGDALHDLDAAGYFADFIGMLFIKEMIVNDMARASGFPSLGGVKVGSVHTH